MVVCLLALGLRAHADGCPRGLAGLGLDAGQIAALEATRPTHDVTILADKSHVVILLGEVHIQNSPTYEAGARIVRAFPQRAVERFPGGFPLRALLRFTYFVEGALSGRWRGSTIRAAYAGKPPLHLEDGFVPDDRETVAAWSIPAMLLYPKISLWPILGAVQSFAHAQVEAGLLWTAGTMLSWVGGELARTLFMEPAGEALRPRRDVHMAGSLVRYFQDHPDDRIILAVVGESHLWGMSGELVRNGFAEVYAHRRPREERGVLDGF